YQGGMCGKPTFIGAFLTGPPLRNGSLHAALDGVTVRTRFAPGDETDWARGKKFRFLAQDEKTTTIARETFGSLATYYRLSERRSATATRSWGPGTGWRGRQLWLMTPERVVGLVQMTAETEQQSFGLDTRVILTSGRHRVSGERRELIQKGDTHFGLGRLEICRHSTSFGGATSIKRFGVMNHPGDDYTVQITWSDDRPEKQDQPTIYPAKTNRWTVLEVKPNHHVWSSAKNVMPDNETWGVLDVEDTDSSFRLIHNHTNQPMTYRSVMLSNYDTASIHADWLESGVNQLGIEDGRVELNLEIPAAAHAVVVISSSQNDHRGNTYFFEDIFDVVSLGVPELP
ncbi:MAG: hypothetical protein AAF986_07655, partial [Pseudomonadota bacterium]